ncbi:MAG: DinB family protein [Vicinamibacterales bacterium]
MPEGDYAFKPTPQVRSFGQLVGHLINDHYLMCSAAKGEKSPSAADFEKVTAKAELVKALGDSIAYCDAVFSSMTDASALQPVEAFGQKVTRFGSEHYGNMVTYMRLKGLVPPSSASSH